MCQLIKSNIPVNGQLKLVVLLLLAFPFFKSFSQEQNSELRQAVTLNYTEVALEEILDEITAQTGIEFSYNSKLVDSHRDISYQCKGEPLNEVLDELFDLTNLEYSLVGQHLVLKKKSRAGKKPVKKQLRFTISGFVIDAHTKEALIGAAVYNAETGMGALTNNYGFFSITLPVGKYQIEISYLGYGIASRQINLEQNTIWNANLAPMNAMVEEVIVSSESKEAYIFKSLAGQTTIKPIEIKKETAVLGETDVLRSLDKIPGISFQGDGSSYFYVRGGNRDQNLILIDEAPVFNPTHMFGLFTPIIPNAVKSVDVYKADVPIQHGGRLSSVIDIHTKDGNKQRFSGSASMGVVSTRFSVEGPILKDKSSFFVSYRRSYFQWLLKRIIPEITELNFTDYTTKFNIQLSNKDRLFLTYYHGADNISTLDGETSNGIQWSNNTGSIRWNHIFADKLFLNTTSYFSSYDYKLHIDKEQNKFWSSQINSAHLKSELTFYASPKNKLKFGVKVGGYFFTPGRYNGDDLGPENQVSDLNSSELIIYAGNRQQLTDKLLFNYGLRLSYWNNTGESYIVEYDDDYEPIDIHHHPEGELYYGKAFLEPRLSLTYRNSKLSSYKLSYNRSIQNIHLINNSISPFNTQEIWLPSGPNIKPQLANTYNLGYLHSWQNRPVDFNIDLYYKTLYNQIGYTEHANIDLNTFMEGELRQGDGKAYGLELSLAKNTGRLSWQLNYAFNRTILLIDGLNSNNAYRARQDKPIEFSASTAYFARPRWLLSLNYLLSSGMVTTTPTGFFNYRGTQAPIYNELNNDRLPLYSRIDFGSDIRLNKNPDGPVEHHLIISIYNMFYKKNSAFLYFTKTVDENGNFSIPTNKLQTQPLVTTHRYVFAFIPSFTYTLQF